MMVGDPVKVKGRIVPEKITAIDGEYIGIRRKLNNLLTPGTFEYTTWYKSDELEAAE